jgi:hypothetical protein
MKKILLFSTALILNTVSLVAQKYAAPYLGYQADLNNDARFKQMNMGCQFSFGQKSGNELNIQLQYALPFAYTSNDSSFTANPSLPVYSSAKKTIKPGTASFALGGLIKLAGKNSANHFYVILSGGLAHQHIAVNYSLDKTNYTVLNPDKTQDLLGIFLSGGIEYARQLAKGRVVFQILSSTPLLMRKISYPSSFKTLAPLAFNTGYSIPLKKK